MVGQIIGTVLVGAIAGYLASIVVGTNKEQGCIADIIVGVVGAAIGRLLLPFFPGGRLLGGFVDTIIFAVVGAIILLVGLQIIFRGRRSRRRRR